MSLRVYITHSLKSWDADGWTTFHVSYVAPYFGSQFIHYLACQENISVSVTLRRAAEAEGTG